MKDNEGKVRGTIFGVTHQVIPGKKKPEEVYNKYVFTIEVGGRYPTMPELEYFGTNDLDMYNKGDFVEIDYELRGKTLKRKDNTEYIRTTPTIIRISYGDLATQKKHIKHVDDSGVDWNKLMVEVEAPEIIPTEDDLPF